MYKTMSATATTAISRLQYHDFGSDVSDLESGEQELSVLVAEDRRVGSFNNGNDMEQKVQPHALGSSLASHKHHHHITDRGSC